MDTLFFLHCEIMPYDISVYKEIIALDIGLEVVYNSKKKLTSYIPPILNNANFTDKSTFSKFDLLKIILAKKPKILVVTGWAELDYLYLAKKVRSLLNIPVVCRMDTQYLRRIKQYLGIFSSFFYLKPCFSHIWVPGIRQYEFARLLGYKKDKIIMNMYVCDLTLFNAVDISKKALTYPKNLLFVGRFANVKGLELLLDAWNSLEEKNGWTLTLIGNGPLKDKLLIYNNVNIFDFMDQQDLIQIAQESGCLVLPSLYEPWGMVIQEFAAAGLPILCSDACGASTMFVEHGYNGLIFKTGNEENLKACLIRIMNTKDEVLLQMGERSRRLARRLTPEMSAYSLLSILDQ